MIFNYAVYLYKGVWACLMSCMLFIFRLPAAKQERALVSWLNSHLSGLETDFDRSKEGPAGLVIHEGSKPPPSKRICPLEVLESGENNSSIVAGQQPEVQLSLQRLSSQVRGALWRQYRGNKVILDAISKVFGKVDGGFYNMSEVRTLNSRHCYAAFCLPFTHY